MTAALAGTVGEALGSAAAALEAAGAETPRLDAELLLSEATGRSRAALAAGPDLGVTAAEARGFGGMVRRRVAREPLAYITGRRGFRRLELRVDRRALIPRPETELLVEVAVSMRPERVLDVGTGCGAVALAIADELPQATVTGTDTSGPALELARANAAALGLAERVRFLAGSLPLGADVELLVANLPYVAEAEWDALQDEIRRWEPREALVAGPTGLEAIDALLATIATGKARAAALALEVGAGQAPAVGELVRRAGFDRLEPRRDLAGVERVVVGR